MSNEQILEELLTKAHQLGFCPEIFDIVKNKYSNIERLDAYQKAFHELETKTEIVDIKNKKELKWILDLSQKKNGLG